MIKFRLATLGFVLYRCAISILTNNFRCASTFRAIAHHSDPQKQDQNRLKNAKFAAVA